MKQLFITKSITKKDSTSFEKYLKDIGKVDLLTPEEEILLAQRIRKGDDSAFVKLVNANLRFVVSVAKKYQYSGLSLPDIVNEGNLGLIKATRLFDETRGFKFISYAVWWIRQSILVAIAEQTRIVRIPINIIGGLSQVNKITMKFQQGHDRMPTSEELAETMDVPEYKLEKLIKSNNWKVSIDAPSRQDANKRIIDFMEDKEAIAPEKHLMDQSLKYEINCILKTLPIKEQKVLISYYGLNGRSKTLIEIGQIMNISSARVRQIKDKALRKLRKPTKQKLLREYLAQ